MREGQPVFKVDQKQFEKNMNTIAIAIQASSSRTVKAMGLNAKDRTAVAQWQAGDAKNPGGDAAGHAQGQPRC